MTSTKNKKQYFGELYFRTRAFVLQKEPFIIHLTSNGREFNINNLQASFLCKACILAINAVHATACGFRISNFKIFYVNNTTWIRTKQTYQQKKNYCIGCRCELRIMFTPMQGLDRVQYKTILLL